MCINIYTSYMSHLKLIMYLQIVIILVYLNDMPSTELNCDNVRFFPFISLQAIATPFSSVVTMVIVFLIATDVTTLMTVEITVMKMDVVWFIT